jgi:protein-S-isoprenylcysteine O-methyltransferase Ste14
VLIRAIAAFVALPGLVAFALPITIGIFAGRPLRHVGLAAGVLGLGTVLLLWCVREFYLAVVVCAFHVRVLLAEEPWAERRFGEKWQAYRARVPRWVINPARRAIARRP